MFKFFEWGNLKVLGTIDKTSKVKMLQRSGGYDVSHTVVEGPATRKVVENASQLNPIRTSLKEAEKAYRIPNTGQHIMVNEGDE